MKCLSREHVVIMARRPEPGCCKTRLIPMLGARGAAQLHAELLAGTIAVVRRWARRAKGSFEVRLCGGGKDGALGRMLNRVQHREQGPGDLGERMGQALREALEAGAHKVVVVGADCPDLEPRHLQEAHRVLHRRDIVFGAARDGGYYLVGARRMYVELFDGMPWGAADLLRRSVEAAGRLGLATHTMEALPDLDTPSDLVAWAHTRVASRSVAPRLSVIVPTLNEEDEIAPALVSALRCPGVEVIVCDGGSGDRTTQIARALGARVVLSPPSRGRQLEAGASAARGDTLVFLHADSRLPPDYQAEVHALLSRRRTAVGAFQLAIDGPGVGLRLVEGGVRVRSLLFRLPYGDQAFFLRSRTLAAAGGFPDVNRMEDYVLLQRLRPLGAVRLARTAVRTSDRKWRRHGILRTTLRHQQLLVAHHFGHLLRAHA